MKTREEYITQIKTKLDELNAQLESLEREIDGKKLEANTEWNSHVEDLKSKRQQLDRKLQELKAASEDSWQSIKDGADSILKEAKNTYDKVEQRLSAAVS